MEILTARQKKAEELKRLTDLASQMAEMQLAELRAEIKVSPESPEPEPGARALAPWLLCGPRALLSEAVASCTQLSFTGLKETVQKGGRGTDCFLSQQRLTQIKCTQP